MKSLAVLLLLSFIFYIHFTEGKPRTSKPAKGGKKAPKILKGCPDVAQGTYEAILGNCIYYCKKEGKRYYGHRIHAFCWGKTKDGRPGIAPFVGSCVNGTCVEDPTAQQWYHRCEDKVYHPDVVQGVQNKTKCYYGCDEGRPDYRYYGYYHGYPCHVPEGETGPGEKPFHGNCYFGVCTPKVRPPV